MAKNNKVTTWTIIVSAIAGLVGIQSKENHERDFKNGKFWHFFIAGVLVTAAFMVSVWLAVELLLSSVK